MNYGNIEGFDGKHPDVFSADVSFFNNLSGMDLIDQKEEINSKISEITADIKKVADAVNKRKMEVQDIAEQYLVNQANPDTNFDKAAEPLKDETLKFSNYSYVPLAYYPIGCLFLLFLIYKKL